MNSLSCVLSYNYYDYKALLKNKDGKVGRKKVLHESTLVRQSLYFCLFFLLLLSLTVATLISLVTTRGLTLVDQFGYSRVLGEDGTFCYKLLGIGWGSFLLAWIINIVFYCVHPSKGISEIILVFSIYVSISQLMSFPSTSTERCSSILLEKILTLKSVSSTRTVILSLLNQLL